MSTFTKLESAFAMASSFALGCRFLEDNPDHCGNNEGDAYCAELGLDGALLYCEAGTRGCITPGYERFGCVAERPPGECYDPCGGPGTLAENGGCQSESGTTELTTSTAGPTSTINGSLGDATGPMPCTADEDCMDPMLPLCDTTNSECVACDAFGASGDAKCAGLDPMVPICMDGRCVACTSENPVACDDQLLLCNGATNSCVGCTEHGQCRSEACELATGRCFPEDLVLHVDGDELAMPPQLYASIVTAVAAVPEQAHAVIIVHEYGAMGDSPYAAGVLVDGGKSIALLAASGESPIIRGAAGNPGVRVREFGTALYVDGIQISDNLGNIGVEVSSGASAWLDRSKVVRNTGGGILAQDGAMLTLRNCFVDGDDGFNVLMSRESTVDVIYSTLGAGLGASTALACDETSTVTVRNSLLVSLDFGDEVDCPDSRLTASHSAAEHALNGTDNVVLGIMDGMDAMTWFQGYDSGDFHLMNPPLSVATAAQWTDGDPTVDIDEEARPQVDGTLDIAGADILQ